MLPSMHFFIFEESQLVASTRAWEAPCPTLCSFLFIFQDAVPAWCLGAFLTLSLGRGHQSSQGACVSHYSAKPWYAVRGQASRLTSAHSQDILVFVDSQAAFDELS